MRGKKKFFKQKLTQNVSFLDQIILKKEEGDSSSSSTDNEILQDFTTLLPTVFPPTPEQNKCKDLQSIEMMAGV